MSIETLKQQLGQGELGNFPITETATAIASMSQDDRWSIIKQEFQKATLIATNDTPILFFLVDRTVAGGDHLVRALYHPIFHGVAVEIPGDNQAGKFPTILHALETVSTITKLSATKEAGQPGLKFLPSQEFDKIAGQIRQPEVVLIPLMVDPERTNLVIFHPQARTLDPESIAYGYWRVLPEMDLSHDLIRHTMLVTPYQEYLKPNPSNKNAVAVEIWLHKQIGDHFRLIDMGRIKPWHQQDPISFQLFFRHSGQVDKFYSYH